MTPAQPAHAKRRPADHQTPRACSESYFLGETTADAAPLMAVFVGQIPRARVRKAAIWALVTGWSGQKRVPAVLQPLVMPAAAMAAMASRKMLFGATSVNWLVLEGMGSFWARVRKAAIWALVTGWSGQKRVPAVLQPLVMPAAAMAAMASRKMLFGATSVNWLVLEGMGSFWARVRKAAIWALVTGWSGQKRVPAVLQPLVMPARAIDSMAVWWVLPSMSVNAGCAGWVGGGAAGGGAAGGGAAGGGVPLGAAGVVKDVLSMVVVHPGFE